MSLRMFHARRSDNADPATADKGWRSTPLTCFYCKAPVTRIPRGSRNLDGGRENVEPHFSLKDGAVHDDNCPYALPRLLTALARSRASALMGPSADRGDAFALSLDEARSTLEIASRVIYSSTGTTESTYPDAEKNLTRSMKALGDLLLLRAGFSRTTGFEEALEITEARKSRPWRDFYFGRNAHIKCYRAASRRPGIPFFAAIRAWIAAHSPPSSRTLNGVTLDLAPPAPEKKLRVVISSDRRAALDALAVGQDVIAMGFWNALEDDDGARLSLTASFRDQICVVKSIVPELTVSRSA